MRLMLLKKSEYIKLLHTELHTKSLALGAIQAVCFAHRGTLKPNFKQGLDA